MASKFTIYHDFPGVTSQHCVQCNHTWMAKPFSKCGGTSASQKTIDNFCGLNWQLWRHKHWYMTSLTFV